MDYLNVILKRKWLILAVFLGAIIAAGVFSYTSPKIYRVDTVLEIGYVERERIKVFEAPIQIVEKLRLDVHKELIKARLGIPEEKYPRIKSENPRGTDLLKIEAESTEPKLAKMALQEINSLILLDHQEQVKDRKELLKNDTERLRIRIISLEEEKKILNSQVEILKKVPPEEQTPASQFTLFAIEEKLEVGKREIEDLYLKINSHKRLLDDIQPTRIAKAPLIPQAPIKPRPALNMSIAGILGIFSGIFLAFFQEFLQKNKTKATG